MKINVIARSVLILAMALTSFLAGEKYGWTLRDKAEQKTQSTGYECSLDGGKEWFLCPSSTVIEHPVIVAITYSGNGYKGTMQALMRPIKH